MSNGAQMAYRLGCELSDRIAAIAPVAGSMQPATCRPARPLSVVAFHGTADEHILFGGGAPKVRVDPRPRTDAAVADVLSRWVRHGACPPLRRVSERGSIRVWSTGAACRAGTEVTLYEIRGGGHAWPGGARGSHRGDEPTSELSATDAMWEFFARHPARPPS